METGVIEKCDNLTCHGFKAVASQVAGSYFSLSLPSMITLTLSIKIHFNDPLF